MTNQPPPPPSLPEEDRPQAVKPKRRTPSQAEYQPPPGYVPYTPRKRKRDMARSGLYLPLWSLILMLLVVMGIAGVIIFLVLYLGGPSYVAGGNPQIIIVTAAPSASPERPQVAQTTPTAPLIEAAQPVPATLALEGPTLVPTGTFTPTPIVIAVGGRVRVVSVSRINIRLAPGTNQSIVFGGDPGDTFTVIGGPQQVDELTWWQVQANNGQSGWAAENDRTQQLLEAIP